MRSYRNAIIKPQKLVRYGECGNMLGSFFYNADTGYL